MQHRLLLREFYDLSWTITSLKQRRQQEELSPYFYSLLVLANIDVYINLKGLEEFKQGKNDSGIQAYSFVTSENAEGAALGAFFVIGGPTI